MNNDHESRMARFARRYPARAASPGSEPLSRRVVRAVLTLFGVAAAVAVLALAGYLKLSSDVRHQVDVSNHRWCATLQLLTKHPVAKPADPRANPSRQNTWILYTDFLQLREQLGCS